MIWSRKYWLPGGKYFYFEKVEAENNYNEMAGREERLDITEDQLTVNIIYVKDGQRYFTYRSDCASADGSWITDPLVQIYTGNIHCNYAHSFLTQWTYIPSKADSPEKGLPRDCSLYFGVRRSGEFERIAPFAE